MLRGDCRCVDVHGLAGRKHLLEPSVIHPNVALQSVLEPANHKASFRFVYDHANVRCHGALLKGISRLFPNHSGAELMPGMVALHMAEVGDP